MWYHFFTCKSSPNITPAVITYASGSTTTGRYVNYYGSGSWRSVRKFVENSGEIGGDLELRTVDVTVGRKNYFSGLGGFFSPTAEFTYFLFQIFL